MFDVDEIEISFADQATEKPIAEDLASMDQAIEADKKDAKPKSREEQEYMKLILQAKKRFDINFFR